MLYTFDGTLDLDLKCLFAEGLWHLSCILVIGYAHGQDIVKWLPENPNFVLSFVIALGTML